MKVTVTEKCSRCKREVPKEIDSSDIALLEQQSERRQDALEALKEQISTWPQDDIPELFVYFRGELRTLDRVCSRFCEKTLKGHIDEVFRKIDPTKRKPRKKKTKDGNGQSVKDAAAEAAAAAAAEASEKTETSEVQAQK